MRTDDFDYQLPSELIAQEPAVPRDSCRLLVCKREGAKLSLEHKVFRDIADYLEPGDLLVANKTRVLPARFVGKKPTGGTAEILLLKKREDKDPEGFVWEALVHPGRRLKKGAIINFFEPSDSRDAPAQSACLLRAQVLDFIPDSKGARLIRFELPSLVTSASKTADGKNAQLMEAIHKLGAVPLPPYIQGYTGDKELYQTVYSMAQEHSAAAPTAGLHFTPELLDTLKAKGVNLAFVELEVGIDTFRLVEEDNPLDHVMHTERYHVDKSVVEAVRATKKAGKRVIAVGTTSVRSLEAAYDADEGQITEKKNATTDLFLLPGSSFHVVDAMITNFHVPRSTLMMLVSAFAGRENIMDAYAEAVREKYRFFSFGDAMFIY